MLTLLLGGARAGKSAAAQRLAEGAAAPITLIATAEPLDEEMAERIRQHRRSRPSTWTTIEEPLDLHRALARVDAREAVVVDCLTLWVSNLLGKGATDAEILTDAEGVASLAADRPGRTVVVTNEVGLGIVPFDPETRSYRDTLGRVNTAFASVAERAGFLVAGRVLWLDCLEGAP
ncbi:MAG: bifunctional adenosylcobinamide kinase/adenosylcobinamide-phosphate guanylyltransferase [Actinomycetota bacterium]